MITIINYFLVDKLKGFLESYNFKSKYYEEA